MAFSDELEQVLFQQQQIQDFSMITTLLMVMIAMTVVMMILRMFMVSNRSARRSLYGIDRMNENLREVRQGMRASGYGGHKALSEITDTYHFDEAKDLKRISEIKTMLSASSLFDGSKNEVLVKELKELEDKRKFRGINIVIKPRPEDDYVPTEKIIKGDKDDDNLVNIK